MKYYRATKDKYKIFKKRGWDIAFVQNELLTEKELKKQCEREGWNFDKIVEQNFLAVEISKRDIYWFFGCRFA